MTGRNLIHHICETTQNLDEEIPIQILHRDKENCVVRAQVVETSSFINGKLLLEASSLRERDYHE